MESNFPLNSMTIALLVPLILLVIKKWKKSKANISVKLPPGPKKLPIIGDLHRMSGLPFRCFRDLAKKFGPIMHLKLGEVSTIVVSSQEIAKEVLKEQGPCFADRPETIGVKIMFYDYRDIAFCPYGNYWRQMRKICVMELLSAKNVRSFSSIRNEEVSRMIEAIRLSCGKPVNLTEKIFSTMSAITCRTAFGKVREDSETMIKLMKAGLELAAGFELADLFPSSKIISTLSWSKLRLLRMRRKLDVILDDIINEHKGNLEKMAREDGDLARRGNGEFGNEDLVDVFLRVKESGELEFPIGNDNIKANIHEMFAGGTDTSSATIDWTMVELMRKPQVMAKARAEVRKVCEGSKTVNENDVQKLKYLKFVVMESLRLHPPVPIIPRASREETKINGYTIPAKVKVLVNNWAIQRDPMYWTNPESFEPERFNEKPMDFVRADFQYLPFGSGKRVCPGMTFGLANVEFTLAQLLYSFNWKLPDGVKAEGLNMNENHGITCLRKDNLFVVVTPHESSS